MSAAKLQLFSLMNSAAGHWLTIASIGLTLTLASCKSRYITSLKNGTNRRMAFELVKNRANVDAATAYQYSEPIKSCLVISDPDFIRIKCRLDPGEEIWVGEDRSLFSVTPFHWDSAIARRSNGCIVKLTASSLPSQITDTSRYRCCGEGQLEIHYTVEVK